MGSDDSEFDVSGYVDPENLPGERVDRTGNDEVAAKAFTAACTAMGGPAAGLACDWYTHGGAAWIQEGIMSLLPDSWKAQGTFDWVSYVIEPIRAAAMLTFRAEAVAATGVYRRMLEHQGLVDANAKTPPELLWTEVRKNIKGAENFEFSEWIYSLALNKFGAAKKVEVFDGVQGFATIRSRSECQAITGSVSWTNIFCTKLAGISATPSDEDVERLANTLRNAYTFGRLVPYQKATAYALDAAQVAAQKKSKPWSKVRFRLKKQPKGPAIAATGAALVTCGILWFVIRRP